MMMDENSLQRYNEKRLMAKIEIFYLLYFYRKIHVKCNVIMSKDFGGMIYMN